MRVIVFAIAIGLCVLGGGQAWALPTGSYDAMVSVGNSYTRNLVLGDTIDFDYWFETFNVPPYSGQSWDVMALQTAGDWIFLGQVASYVSSTDWQSASLSVPLALRGFQRDVRFSVSDFGPDTDPVVYLRDISSAAPVPEPASMLLLGTGLVGLAGFRLRRKTE